MCTVTCLIKPNDIILTSNRDIPKERVHSEPPKIYKINSKNILFPLDPVGNGSWIGTNDSEIICLLNHKGEQNGVESRGLIIREILSGKLNIKDLNRACKKYSPFKLIYLNKNENLFYEITWDSKTFNIDKIIESVKIWSSTSIYNDEQIKKKENYFNLNCNIKSSSKDMLNFHQDSYNLLNENFSKTTSITQVIHGMYIKMYYKDLVNEKDYDINFSL